MTFINNIKGAFASTELPDRGSLVEVILIISGFAVVAILVVSWIGSAIAGQAANTSACIANANASQASDLNDTCTSDTYNVKSGVSNTISEEKGNRF